MYVCIFSTSVDVCVPDDDSICVSKHFIAYYIHSCICTYVYYIISILRATEKH